MSRVRRFTLPVAAALLATLAACGGGGAGSSSTPPPPALPTGSNVAALIVDAGPAQIGINIPSVSVTICVPGTSTCQTIDHVLVDTGSTGLRVISTVLDPALSGLPLATTASGDPMYECLLFADGYSWGSVRRADLQLADGRASNLAIQVIIDGNTPPAVPADCSGNSSPQDTVAAFGANGVLGVSVFLQDCGPACETRDRKSVV